PQYEYGSEFPDEGFGSISSYTPEFVAEAPQPVAASAPATSAPATSSHADDQWEEVELATPSQEEPSRDEPPRGDVEPPQPQQIVEPTSLQELPTADEALFPKTDTPDALNFFMLHPIQTSPMNSPAPQSQPEVAGRPSAKTTR
ncbi:MAG: hypothetical protein ACR2NM_06065, partial [Bythopirellula sp.]